MPSKLWIPQPPEGLPRRRLADLLGIEIEMPVDFAAPVNPCSYTTNTLFGRASDSLCRGLRQHGFLHPRVGVSVSMQSTESSIDMVKRHHFFTQRLAR